MKTNRHLQVRYKDRLVGTLALASDYKVAFEYADNWLEEGFPISPFSLPLRKQVFVPVKEYFWRLLGVFSGSLPEAVLDTDTFWWDPDTLAEECKKILNTEYSEDLDALFQMRGTSGGARPQIINVMDTLEQSALTGFQVKTKRREYTC